MRRARVTLFLALFVPVAAAAVAACSLLVPLDGFADGERSEAGDAATDTLSPPDVFVADTTSEDVVEGGPSRSEAYAQAVLADRPLGYWRLEETSGTVAKDETGRYDGTYMLSPLFGASGVAGSRGIKLGKDTNARIEVPSPVFRFVGLAAYSVELWAEPGVLENYQWLSGTEHTIGGARAGWSLLADSDGALRYEVWRPNGDGGTNQVRGVFMPSPVAAGRLHHIVVTFDGATVIGYVDGLMGTPFKATGVCPDVGPLLWACRGDLNHCLDDWTIDELAIYDAALPSARVNAHYALGR